MKAVRRWRDIIWFSGHDYTEVQKELSNALLGRAGDPVEYAVLKNKARLNFDSVQDAVPHLQRSVAVARQFHCVDKTTLDQIQLESAKVYLACLLQRRYPIGGRSVD